jgi:hypothetical protein
MDVREAPMASLASGLKVKSGPHLRAIEKAFRVGQEVERARRRTKLAQRSAAECFEKSAAYHDRAAASYDELAKFGAYGADYSEHATRHREVAWKDRRVVQRL